jgi:hypothetical protein
VHPSCDGACSECRTAGARAPRACDNRAPALHVYLDHIIVNKRGPGGREHGAGPGGRTWEGDGVVEHVTTMRVDHIAPRGGAARLPSLLAECLLH